MSNLLVSLLLVLRTRYLVASLNLTKIAMLFWSLLMANRDRLSNLMLSRLLRGMGLRCWGTTRTIWQ